MAKHRSLSSALLAPETLAFVKGCDPGETVKIAEPQSALVVDIPPEISSTDLRPRQNPSDSQYPLKPNKVLPDSTSALETEDYLIAITTRLRARTAEALRRAYLEHKLNRHEPGTQQEIIEAALQHWLRKNSFLD